MGTVYKKKYTQPLPKGAEIIEVDGVRIAHWRLRNGEQRSAEVIDGRDGSVRARGESEYYMARYRNGENRIVENSTGCRDKVAAQSFLAKVQRRAELVKAGVLTDAEASMADHAAVSLSKHLDAYEKHLQAKNGEKRRISMVRRRLERLFEDCRFTKLNKMAAGPVEDWLVEQAEKGMSAATRNGYRESLVCFGNWCRRIHRLTSNPFQDLPRANQNADRRHQRRALTEVELLRLLKVARFRPLAEFGRAKAPKDNECRPSPKSRATWKREPLTYENVDEAVERGREAFRKNPDLVDELGRTGHERALIYKTLALTGLRKGELSSLTVGQLELDGRIAYAVLNPEDEKNRNGSNIPLRADLVGELSEWLAEKLRDTQRQAIKSGKPIPVRLPPRTPLFNVPSGLTRILNRDLAAAAIPKRDERNRVVDIHALRVTFGTHLCAAGVPLRTAQAAMRHSKPELTANIYTDPKLLDIAGAIDALPALKNLKESASVRKAASGQS